MDPARRHRICIFCQPRTCSMLFQRLLSQHPQLGHVFHPFSAAAMYGPERIQLLLKSCEAADQVQRDWGSNYPDMNEATYDSSERELWERVSKIESEGNTVCVKDHVACIVREELLIGDEVDGNPTRLPNEFLETITHPILLIRHPVLMIRSFWETQQTVYKLQPEDALFTAMTTLRWTARLYDWFVEHGIQPTVIDGSDIASHAEALMSKVCVAAELDPSGVIYEWQAESEVDFADNHMRRVFLGKLQRSTGVSRDLGGAKDDQIDLNAQIQHWKSIWGEGVAEKLNTSVQQEIPLYRELKAMAMQV